MIMKKIIIGILIILCISLSGCAYHGANQDSPIVINKTDGEEGTFIMKIDDTIVDATWENNDSVKKLLEYAKNGLKIAMHQYGGFEQVGSIGATLPSNDKSITTSAGDICLYQSNQLVVFYGSNTWSYTKLGHINLSKSELTELLDNKDVGIELSLEKI